MRNRLPPLNALRAFEAAARLLSFSKAADELHVTPAAVSHQVKSLEARLGVKLFRRVTRAVRLTDAGRAALPAISAGFAKLEEGVQQLHAYGDDGLLTVSVSPSFGAMWLVPRLERFRQCHPEIEVRLDGTDRRVDVAEGEADVAIRYGPGGYSGVRADYLFGQQNTPVCAPALLEGPRALRRPQDLKHHTLLHIEWKDAEASWRMWLLAAGLTDVDPGPGPRFTMESMAVQAAVDGQGVALVGDKLVQEDIAAGRLVRPFEAEFSTPLSFAFYLLSARDSAELPRVSAFREWLLDEAQSDFV